MPEPQQFFAINIEEGESKTPAVHPFWHHSKVRLTDKGVAKHAGLSGRDTIVGIERLDADEFEDRFGLLWVNDNERAVNRMVRKLCDLLNDDLILMADPEKSVYLIPAVQTNDRPMLDGAVQYQVSDGLPGVRSHCNSFWTLQEAAKAFREVSELGWQGYFDKYNTKVKA